MTVKVQLKFFKNVSHWSGEHGQGVTIDGESNDKHWMIDYSWLDGTVVASDHTDVEQSVRNYLAKSYIPSDYLAIMDDGRLSFSTIEDGEGNIIEDADEQDRLEEDGVQLYICDYDIMVNVLAEPTADQLSILFPKAEKCY
jgi:hypothetical protein